MLIVVHQAPTVKGAGDPMQILGRFFKLGVVFVVSLKKNPSLFEAPTSTLQQLRRATQDATARRHALKYALGSPRQVLVDQKKPALGLI